MATKKSKSRKKVTGKKASPKKRVGSKKSASKKTVKKKAPTKKASRKKTVSKKPVKTAKKKTAPKKPKIQKKAKPSPKTKTKTKAPAKAKKAKTKVKTKATKKTVPKKKAVPKPAKKPKTSPPTPPRIESPKPQQDAEFNEAIRKIQDRLLQTRAEKLKLIESAQALERNVDNLTFSNEIDLASDLEGREMAFQLSSRDRNELRMIEDALYKIKEGTYGICENCSKRISLKRLQILPLTTLCIECQESLERG